MDFDGYCESSSDDDENAICCSHHYSSESASDDDGDLSTILQYSANRIKHQGQYCTTDAPTLADPFEEELAGELDQAMLQLRALDGSTGSRSKPNTTAAFPLPALRSSESRAPQPQQDLPKSQYDSIYFDSDEDDADEVVQRRRATRTDADLLYDPSMDDRDQQWMDDHRAAAHRTGLKRRDRREGTGSQPNKHQKTKPGKGKALPDSDAVLNCPGCLTMLCADCQRHAIYSTQFRAMFVFSCKVDYTQLLRFPTKLTKKEIWKNKKLERKMRQTVKKNEKNCEFNGVDAGALLEEALLKKNEGVDAAKMECYSNKSSNVAEDCGEGEPTEDSESKGPHPNKEPHPNDKKGNQEQAKTLPVKKVRFNTEENDYDAKAKNGPVSESSGTSGHATEAAWTGGALLQSQDKELYHPVTCQHCNTKVAVLDKDEVYHFFNVITSY